MMQASRWGFMWAGMAGVLVGAGAQAQPAGQPASPLAQSELAWQQCQRLPGSEARLACYDRWAQQQTLPAAAVPAAPAVLATTQPDGKPATPVDASIPATRVVEVATVDGCRDRQYSTLSRFWELEDGSDCGVFGFRGYRPLNVSFSGANDEPDTPTSPAPGHTGTPTDYQAYEMRIALSVRTKLAQGMLTGDDPFRKDSLWFGYTQKSTWQIFNSELSRPFRTTDHEPEIMYVYPTDVKLPGGWRWRYAGAGLVHQSNGQSQPLSRSWNRFYVMGGMELDDRFQLTARVWDRVNEDPENDDNPDIVDFLGHGDLRASWNYDHLNTFALSSSIGGKGSVRLEWLRAIGDPDKSNLRFHVQLFNGYGDTLVDYNRSRTVLSVGLSLVDF